FRGGGNGQNRDSLFATATSADRDRHPVGHVRIGHKKLLAGDRVFLAALGRLELDSFGVEAARGFGDRDGTDKLALRHARQEVFLLLVRAAFDKQRRREQRGGEEGSRHQNLAGFFDNHRHVEETATLAAVTLRYQQPRPSKFDQLFPEGGVVRSGIRHHLADKLGRAVVGQKALGRVPKHLLFFRKSEIHLAFLRFVDGESCGLK